MHVPTTMEWSGGIEEIRMQTKIMSFQVLIRILEKIKQGDIRAPECLFKLGGKKKDSRRGYHLS